MHNLSPAWRRSLARKLLAWFDRHARDLPWRQTRDLYAIWISEVMLQQTQVATVVPYWHAFLARFPDVAALAAADEQQVLRLWEGLGYYRRARQLHAAAQKIAADHAGQFPTAFDQVRALPGIGRYTAGAILSIGCDQRLPILEANTVRVLSRLTSFRGAVASAAGQKKLWSVAEAILPTRRCGAFNQSLMELGSEICTPRAPACDRCPIAGLCQAREKRLVAQIPRPAKRAMYEDVTEVAVVIHQNGRVALRRCQPGERWAGLWDFPRFAVAAEDCTQRSENDFAAQIRARTHDLTGLKIAAGRRVMTLKHGVTRFRITLHCYQTTLQRGSQCLSPAPQGESVQWVKPERLAEYPLSVTGRKITRLLLKRPLEAAAQARNRLPRVG